MDNFESHQQLLAAIADEWFQAEADIKQAEQVCEQVVTPSVFELRYAGRRILEAIRLGPADQKKIDDLLRDAKMDCHRARHDAVDAATSQIAKNIDGMIAKLGHEIVLSFYPKLADLRSALEVVREGIVHSRRDIEDRDVIYRSIETKEFPALIKLYRSLQLVEGDMANAARSKRKRFFVEHTVAIVAAIISGFALIAQIFDIHLNIGR